MNESPIVRRTVVVNQKDPLGLHMRPALSIANIAGRYKCKLEITRDIERKTDLGTHRETVKVDAKSVLELMTLVAEPGVELTLEGQGEDAEAAIDKILRYIEDGFPIIDTKSQKPA